MKWTGDSVSKNSFIIMLTTFCSRVFGLVRTMILSRFLGTGSEADIFYLTFKIPNLFRRLFAEGSISAAFVPIYSILVPSKEKSSLFFSQIFTLFFIFLILFILAFQLFSPGIMMLYINPSASLKDQELWTLSVLALKIMFPYLFFISLSAILQGVLNSKNHFFSPAFTPILLNLSMIVSAGLALIYSGNFVIALSYGVLIGGCLQFIWLLPFLFRYHKKLFTFKLSLKKYHHLKKFFILILPVSFSAGIYQINQLITDFIAYPLGDGAISSLQYSRTLQEFPLGVIIISVSTICLPLFSRLLSEQNIHQLQSVFRRNFRMLFFIINPIVFITILCSEDIVRLLFKGYHFNQVSVNMTSICLTIHIIGLIPIFIAKMQQTLLFSFKNTRIPLEAALVAMVSNIIIALVVSSYIWRHPGSIALAGTFSTLVMVFYFGFRLFFSRHSFSSNASNNLRLSEIKIFRGNYKDFFINLLYSLIIAVLVYQFLLFGFVSQLMQQLTKIAFFQDFLSFLIKALLFGVPYYFISRYFKHTEYLVFLKKRR